MVFLAGMEKMGDLEKEDKMDCPDKMELMELLVDQDQQAKMVNQGLMVPMVEMVDLENVGALDSRVGMVRYFVSA